MLSCQKRHNSDINSLVSPGCAAQGAQRVRHAKWAIRWAVRQAHAEREGAAIAEERAVRVSRCSGAPRVRTQPRAEMLGQTLGSRRTAWHSMRRAVHAEREGAAIAEERAVRVSRCSGAPRVRTQPRAEMLGQTLGSRRTAWHSMRRAVHAEREGAVHGSRMGEGRCAADAVALFRISVG